jgi:hypothetical protein
MVKVVIHCLTLNSAYETAMPLVRGVLVGAPHTYVVQVSTALGVAVFDRPGEADHLLTLIARLRQAFDLRLFGYLITQDGLRLVLRHHAATSESDDRLRARWALIDGSPLITVPRIKQRFASLGGFMQTLLQRFSREWNRRHDSRGHLWSGRYRACLLADDNALLAAVAWVEDEQLHRAVRVVSSAIGRGAQMPVPLAPLPIRRGPDGSLFTADESPPGLPPLTDQEGRAGFRDYVADLPPSDLAAYGTALSNGWALGRPESLSGLLSRIGRSGGRGRSRQLRELDDRLGLCEVWG